MKAASEFNRHRHSKDGLQSWCRPCQNEERKLPPALRDGKRISKRRLTDSDKENVRYASRLGWKPARIKEEFNISLSSIGRIRKAMRDKGEL